MWNVGGVIWHFLQVIFILLCKFSLVHHFLRTISNIRGARSSDPSFRISSCNRWCFVSGATQVKLDAKMSNIYVSVTSIPPPSLCSLTTNKGTAVSFAIAIYPNILWWLACFSVNLVGSWRIIGCHIFSFTAFQWQLTLASSYSHR